MTLSQLVEKLQAMQIKHGDLEVFVDTDCDFSEIREIRVRPSNRGIASYAVIDATEE